MNYDNEIYLLSSKFTKDYPTNRFPELMYKLGRPYSCLLIDSHCDYFICVPYRSSICHKNAFMFKNSVRSIKSKSGLDYSKIVLIKDIEYLDNRKAIIDKDEYNETITHLSVIVSEVIKYIDNYKAHIEGTRVLNTKEFERKYKFSTLKYFHELLCSNEKQEEIL